MPQADQSPLVVGHARVLPAQIGHGLTVTLGARPEDRQIRVRDPLSGRIARPWPVVLGHPDQPRHLIDHARALEICFPYLGEMAGVYSDWTPLQGRGELFPEDLDKSDPWQFKNFRVI